MTIEHPRHLELETSVCTGHPVRVSAPRSPHGRRAADRIYQALKDIGADVTLVEDPSPEALIGASGPVFVVGNLADRIRLGFVIDFLDFSVKSYHWPAFNLADSAVTIGALWLLLNLVLGKSLSEASR